MGSAHGTLRVLMATPIGRLRLVAFVEGCSYLLLLGVAMPLKYWAGIPLAVRIVGALHGGLFILFCVALASAMITMRWSGQRSGGLFLSALIPFGTFVVDGSLKREDQSRRSASEK